MESSVCPSDRITSLLQLCAPCQAAIRSGDVQHITRSNLEASHHGATHIWSCALCSTIISSEQPYSFHGSGLIAWLKNVEKGLRAAATRRRLKNLNFHQLGRSPLLTKEYISGKQQFSPEPPIGDITDIILLVDVLDRTESKFENDDLETLLKTGNHDRRLGHPILRKVPRKCIDTDLLNRWIAYCEQHHDGCQHASKQAETDMPMIFIDVKKRKLARLSSRTRYFALSYVWGKVQQFLLTQASADRLMVDYSLDDHWKEISAVLIDAMLLVQALGEQYLWVDTLCIIQDSPARFEDIGRMDKIYRGAVCTLIAMDGQDASSSLPGVLPNSRNTAVFCKNGNVHIGRKRSELASVFRESLYERRAWTFQERFLSIRRLYFTNEQVYFHCENALWSEDRYEYFQQSVDPLGLSPSLTWTPGETNMSHKEMRYAYYQLARQYSQRLFSYEKDRLNAFGGITSSMIREWSWPFSCGIPIPSLDGSLLWMSSELKPARVASDDESLILPTWSWASITGGVHFRISKNVDEHYIDEFGITTPSGKLDIYNVGLKKARSPSIVDIPRTQERRTSTVATDVSLRAILETLDITLPRPPNLLVFQSEKTSSTRYSLYPARLLPGEKWAHDAIPRNRVHRIMDSLQRACGLLVFNNVIPKMDRKACQYVLISGTSKGPFVNQLDDDLNEENIDNTFHHSFYGKFPQSVCNVLLVQETKDGWAERLAVGQIHASAWADAEPEFTTVVLG
ncbi:HET-domain-containing protein, partial [Aaosphaeria arxii CBS 175.79]